jgi:16S rRNA processing protein RimM
MTKAQKDSQLVEMGYIKKSFGIKGWVKVFLYADRANLPDYTDWYYRLADHDSWNSIKLESFSFSDPLVLFKFAGLNDKTSADLMQGATLAVDKKILPLLDNDEFYWRDLLGYRVYSVGSGDYLGNLVDLMFAPHADIMIVDGQGKKLLIPFSEQFIDRVDKEVKTIFVAWELDYV